MTNLDLSAAPTQHDRPANGGPVLEFRNVSIGFERPVLEDVSFTVGHDETRILLGPAGVGKSVLLKLANGLLTPDSGSIYLFGEEISHLPEEELFHLRTRTGMVFQEGALFDSLTVRDNVAFQLIQEEVPDEEIDSARARSAAICGTGADLQPLSRKPLRRHAAARRHRSRSHQQSSSPAL